MSENGARGKKHSPPDPEELEPKAPGPPSWEAEPAVQHDTQPYAPELREDEEEEARKRSAVPASVVHEAIREEGETELQRSPAALGWSGLAAGLSMGFSLVGEGVLRSHLPDAPWRPLISKLGYSLGFLIVVLGRQQLFTENTLTAILPLLARRDRGTFVKVARLWVIVLLTNIAGAALFAGVASHTAAFGPEIRHAFDQLAREAVAHPFTVNLVKGVFAGWLIALMVWLLPASEGARFHVVVLLTYFVGLSQLTHIIAGSVEVLYGAESGIVSWRTCTIGYMLPTLIGNILGGVSLVAALNHAQVIAGREHREPGAPGGKARLA